MNAAFLLSTFASVGAALGASSVTGLLLNTSWTFEQQVTALALQGLGNRAAPTVWLYEPVFWTNNASTYWFATTYLPTLGIEVHNASGICALYGALPAGTVTGIAMYDAAKLDATRWMAVTSAGLQNLVPLSDASLASLPCFAGLPVTVDYRDPAAYGWTTDASVYAWGIEHLLPQCDHSRVYSAGHTYNDSQGGVFLGGDPAIDIGLDIAVAGRFFVFNLSPDPKHYPEDAAAWVSLVAAVAATSSDGIPSVYGWAEPEPDMTGSTSQGGGAVLCDGAPNLSFWTHINNGTTPTLPYNRLVTALNRSEHYIAWQTNEVR